jgi:hypothetical protein
MAHRVRRVARALARRDTQSSVTVILQPDWLPGTQKKRGLPGRAGSTGKTGRKHSSRQTYGGVGKPYPVEFRLRAVKEAVETDATVVRLWGGLAVQDKVVPRPQEDAEWPVRGV